jgi:hypothetical protein
VNRPSGGWLRVRVVHDECDEHRTGNAKGDDAPW